MSKAITLTLTDTEYRELILLYHLGHLVKYSITEKSRADMMQEMKFGQKLSRQAKESGSKHVFTETGIYSITQEMENEMLEVFEEFKGNVEKGVGGAGSGGNRAYKEEITDGSGDTSITE